MKSEVGESEAARESYGEKKKVREREGEIEVRGTQSGCCVYKRGQHVKDHDVEGRK